MATEMPQITLCEDRNDKQFFHVRNTEGEIWEFGDLRDAISVFATFCDWVQVEPLESAKSALRENMSWLKGEYLGFEKKSAHS